MKTVLIEMQKLGNPNSGLGQFCLHLGKAMEKLNPQNLQLDFYLPERMRGIFGNSFGYVNHSSFHKIIPPKCNYDAWHCIHQESAYLPRSRNTPLLLTVHDLNFLQMNRGWKKNRKLKRLRKIARLASGFTAVSEFTKRDMEKHLSISKPIRVIYNGNSLDKNIAPAKPSFIEFSEFIFSISIISPKKNFHSLFCLLENNPSLHWVIAGDKSSDYATSLIRIAEQKGIGQRIHLPGIVSENEKLWLYQNCRAFVFPSLAEGFGLPVIEAMSCGKPVFLSQHGSLPEIGGADAFYWLGFDSMQVAEVFENGLKKFADDRDMVSRLIHRSELFSWERAANEYLKIYQAI